MKDEWISIPVNALSSAVNDDSMQCHTMYEVSSLLAAPMACVRFKLGLGLELGFAAPMACVHANL